MRHVVQFSCGAASAVAAKLILAECPAAEVLIVNAFIQEEDADNRRFLIDCEKWFGHAITTLRDEKYGASVLEVWKRKRYIKGPRGAPCSLALKREPLNSFWLPGDVNVIGFTVEEEDRLIDLQQHFPDKAWRAPLIEKGLTKEDCFGIVDRAGIVLPLMYRMGYDNANCPLCPKGGQNYWQKIRHDFPANFVAVSDIQKSIGPGASFLRFRSGPRKGERMSLLELPAGRGNLGDDAKFECGFVCEQISEDLSHD